MAQTIQVKRSTATAAPAELANGELAYSHVGTDGKLFIGRPGGAVGDVDAIGGKYYVDRSETAYTYSQVGHLPLTGGAITGAITTNSTFDGRDVSVDGSKLDTIETNADVTDTANVTAAGALMDSEVTNLAQVKAFDSTDYATAAQGTTADAALPRAGGAMTGAITTNSTFDGRDVSSDGSKLDTIEGNANNYTLTDLNTHLAGGVGNIVTTGYIRGPAAMVIDPAVHANETGSLTILGDLIVEGTTTTINSTVVEIADARVTVNREQTGTPTAALVAGLEVERGDSTNAYLLWRESDSGWYVSDGGPVDYELLHTNNWSTAYTGVVDGGSF